MSSVGPNPAERAIPRLLESLPETSPTLDAADAAVLIVLRESSEDVETLLIERTVREEDPASGQVGLPGGHKESGDSDLRATALRELGEEVGLESTDLAPGPRFVMTTEARAFAMRVAVFAAGLAEGSARPRVASPNEVAHVFWAPSRSLRTVTRVTQESRFGRIEVDAAIIEGHVLWGFTRRVLGTFFGIPMSEGVTPARAENGPADTAC